MIEAMLFYDSFSFIPHFRRHLRPDRHFPSIFQGPPQVSFKSLAQVWQQPDASKVSRPLGQQAGSWINKLSKVVTYFFP